jgi:hypothetical protein
VFRSTFSFGHSTIAVGSSVVKPVGSITRAPAGLVAIRIATLASAHRQNPIFVLITSLLPHR